MIREFLAIVRLLDPLIAYISGGLLLILIIYYPQTIILAPVVTFLSITTFYFILPINQMRQLPENDLGINHTNVVRSAINKYIILIIIFMLIGIMFILLSIY